MRVLVPGHRYELRNLKSDGTTLLQFFQDGDLHTVSGDVAGPSCQEVLRAVIDRVKYLDREKPWDGNQQIVQKLREVIALFECRALLRKVEKGDFDIENKLVDTDGHLAVFNQLIME